MSQTQEFAAGGNGGGNTGGTSYATGALCPKSGLWKTYDGKMEVIEYYAAGDAFRVNQRDQKCTWTRVTLASDGSKTSFTAVKVAAGTM